MPRAGPRLRPPQLPDPIVGLLRSLRLPATEIGRYWQQEARSIRMGTAALAIGLTATLVAGTVLGAGRDQLARYPGLLVLIPAAIGMRGSIFGALAARLGTGIMTGEFEAQLQRRTFLGRQVEAVAILSVSTATEAGVLAWAVSLVLGIEVIPLLEMVAVSLLGGLLSSVFLLGVTIQVARIAERRGWNMDDVGAPVITATGDLITLPALLLASLVLQHEPTALGAGAVGVAAGLATLAAGWRHDNASIRGVVRESVVVLTAAVTLQVLAGIVLGSREEQLVVEVPALLVLVPPFIATCGSLGGMLASRFASKLHIGLLEPRTFPGRVAGLDISLTFLLALLAFTGVGAIGWVGTLVVLPTSPALGTLVATALLGGALATVALSLVAYGAATATFRFGLDPDNHAIPIVTATMDFLGIVSLIGAVAVLQVG